MCWLTPSEGFPGDVRFANRLFTTRYSILQFNQRLSRLTSIRRRATRSLAAFLHPVLRNGADRRRRRRQDICGKTRLSKMAFGGIRQRPARQFRLAHGGVRFDVGAGGGLRRQSGAALQRQVRLAQRARRGGHLHCARPHHRQDRSQGCARPLRSLLPCEWHWRPHSQSACARHACRRPDGKDGPRNRACRRRPVLPAVWRRLEQACRRQIRRTLFRQDDRGGDDARHHRLDGRTEDRGSQGGCQQRARCFSQRPGSQEATRTRRDRALRRRGQHRQPCRTTSLSRPSSPVRSRRRWTVRWPLQARPVPASTAARPSAKAASNSPTPGQPPPWSTATTGSNSARARR